MKEVIITVNGGLADVHSYSSGIKVKIIDFDVEGKEDREIDLFEGRECLLSEYEAKPI